MTDLTQSIDASKIAAHLDATLLTAEQSDEELFDFVKSAISIKAKAVCVLPKQVQKLHAAFQEGLDPITVACVIGFPHGANLAGVKSWEATLLNNMVDEYDYVPDLNLILSHQWDKLAKELRSFKLGSSYGDRDKVLKVILETSLLNSSEIRDAVKVAVDAEFDFVKTSTGVHPSGGATLEAVAEMVDAGEGLIQVKASGGITSLDTAVEFLTAGATRLGSTKLVSAIAGTRSSSDTDY